MPEMLYIHIKIHHNELISLFFYFSHMSKRRQVRMTAIPLNR